MDEGFPAYPSMPVSGAPLSHYPYPMPGGYGQQGPNMGLQAQQGPPPPYSYGYPPHIPNPGPPPSYYQNMAHPGQMPMAYPVYPGQMHPMTGGVPVQGGYMPNGNFEAGARFGPGGGQPVIPPPPPGYAPNPVQIAAMQGQPVVMDKKKNNFFSGGKGAGSTFW